MKYVKFYAKEEMRKKKHYVDKFHLTIVGHFLLWRFLIIFIHFDFALLLLCCCFCYYYQTLYTENFLLLIFLCVFVMKDITFYANKKVKEKKRKKKKDVLNSSFTPLACKLC